MKENVVITKAIEASQSKLFDSAFKAKYPTTRPQMWSQLEILTMQNSSSRTYAIIQSLNVCIMGIDLLEQKYLVVAIDYAKWVEPQLLAIVLTKQVISFIWKSIISIVTDDTQLGSQLFRDFYIG